MRRAFTLIEVLVAVALVAGLAAAMSGFIWGVRARRDGLMLEAQRLQGVGSLFTQIEGDVLTCLAGEGGRAGVRGGPDRLELLSRGVGLVWDKEGPDTGDLQGSEYAFSGSRLSGRRWKGVTRETSLGDDTILEGVGLVQFRYFDKGTWVTDFDSAQAGRLPAAIEVAVWFTRPAELDAPGADDGFADTPDAIGSQAPSLEAIDGAELRAGRSQPGAPRPSNPDRVRVICIPDGPEAWGAP